MNLAFKTIVVATDFGPQSEMALKYACTLARRFGASLHLLHVVEEAVPTGTQAYVPVVPEVTESLSRQADQRLAETIAEIEDVEVTSEVRTGNPARRITEVATAEKADLIVMGTHGHGTIAHLLLGSVAERVVRTARCPVLTVRAPMEAKPERCGRAMASVRV